MFGQVGHILCLGQEEDTHSSRQVNVNPNIVRQQDSSKWEGVSDFRQFHEPQTIEVWGQVKEPEPLVLIEEPKPQVRTYDC